MDEEFSEFAELDDPEFLAERRRVREALEHVPEQAVSPELTVRYERLNAEFDRRAAAAWKQEGTK
jgi:hypothetical protein